MFTVPPEEGELVVGGTTTIVVGGKTELVAVDTTGLDGVDDEFEELV